MDVAVVKTKSGHVAFSLFPIGVVGWGCNEREAIVDVENNLYDFCNWLLWKLPKETNASVKEKYSGELKSVLFKVDDKKLFKKYAEVVMQTAFSFKCMIDSIELSPTDLEKKQKVFDELGFYQGEGILERASTILEKQDFALAREFIYKIYRLAKELFFDLIKRGVQVSDAFKFAI
jgi:hypothetical protein